MKCPECGSENTVPDLGAQTSFAHGDVNSWRCKECGYSGIMTSEAPKDSGNKNNEETENESSRSRENLVIIGTLIIIILIGFFQIISNL